MNPTQPQQPLPPENPSNNPVEPPASQQVTSPLPAANPPVKSHKKLIIFIVAGAILLFGALGIAGWFVITNVISGINGQNSAESSAEGFLLVGDTPEEVYYNNLAVTYGYSGSYDELIKDNQQSEIERIVQTGRDICGALASKTLSQEETDKKVYASVFATTEGSLCPEQRQTLDALIEGFGDPLLSYTYDDAHKLVLDGTVDVEGLLLAHSFCFASAYIIFGSNDEAVTEEEADEQGKTTCLALLGEFDTDIEFYEWSSNKETERSKILLQLAEEAGMKSTTCTTLIDCAATE